MIKRPFEDISKEDIESLKENSVREGRAIEYKRDLRAGTDGERKEFLADVSSFANASGGDLLFGIWEEEGAPKEIVGLKDLNPDQEIVRLNNMIRSGVEPRIPGVQMKVIEGFTEGPVLLVRIPKSWAGPHMVTFQETSRFHTRNNGGKHQMDVTEIRSAFAESEALPEKIRGFRDDRLGKIIAGETPVPLPDEPKMVLHVIPLSAFSLDFRIDPRTMKEHRSELTPFGGDYSSYRFNLDGFITVEGPIQETQKYLGYCQTFRSGTIETVDSGLTSLSEESGTRYVPTVSYEIAVLEAIPSYLIALSEIEVPGPIVVFLTFLKVDGCELAVNSRYIHPNREHSKIDRDVLLLPDVLIEEYPCDIGTVFRPIFDAVWNSAGWEMPALWTGWIMEDP